MISWVKIKRIKSDKKYSLVGGPFGSNLSGKHYVDFGVPVIRGGNLPFNKKFDTSDFVFVTEKKANSLKSNTAYPGDIVFTQRGTLGQVGIVPNDFDRYIISQSQMKLTVDESKAVSLYVYYYFRTEEAIKRIENVALSSGVPHTNLGILQNFKIPLPDLPTQNKIVSILSAYDDLIENNNQRIQLLEEMAEEIYQEWFVRLRFPGYQDSKFFDKNGKEVPHGTVGALPEGWVMKQLDDVIAKVKRKPKVKKDEYLDEGLIPIIDQGEGLIAGYTNNKEYLHSELLPILVFGDHTRRVKYIDFPFASGADGTQLLYPTNKKLLPTYFYLTINKIDLSNFHYARHFKFLKKENILIPINNIVVKFNNLTAPFLKEIEILRDKNQILQETRDLLLPRLISGKLSVDDLEIENNSITAMAAEPKEAYKS